MRRLTQRAADGGIIIEWDRPDALAALEKLAKFEDAEQSGTLVCLPLKVGDIVYRHHWTYEKGKVIVGRWTHAEKKVIVRKWRVSAVVIDKTGVTFHCYGKSENAHVFFTPEDIGKSVWLTRADAEAALKEPSE